MTDKKRKSSKTTFTATHRRAKYIGSHPYLINTEGVYYFSNTQGTYVYRPDGNGEKTDWFRTFKENIVDLQ